MESCWKNHLYTMQLKHWKRGIAHGSPGAGWSATCVVEENFPRRYVSEVIWKGLNELAPVRQYGQMSCT